MKPLTVGELIKKLQMISDQSLMVYVPSSETAADYCCVYTVKRTELTPCEDLDIEGDERIDAVVIDEK